MDEFLKKQERTSRDIQRAYENLRRIGQANITREVIEADISVLDIKWDAFVKMHEQIEDCATDKNAKGSYFTSEFFARTEDSYDLNKGKFLDMIRQFHHEDVAVPRVSAVAQQLLKLTLPTFSGSYTEWLTFRDLFTSMVINNASISPIEKMHYLKMSLFIEPAGLVASISLTAETMVAVWTTLTYRYENKRLLTMTQIASICSLATVKTESSLELKNLYNGTVNAISALESLGRPVEGYDDFPVYLTVQKLDKQSRREWEASVGSKRTVSTFAELREFLESRMCTVQALEPTESPIAAASGSGGSATSQAGTGLTNNERKRSHQSSSTLGPARKCSFCKQDHYTVFCDLFCAKTVDERKAFVLGNGLCLNCLGQHFVRDCRS